MVLLEFASPGPIVFQVGGFVLRWYGLLIATAVLLGVSLSQFLAQKKQLDPDLIADVAIWLVLAAIPCARIYYVAFQWPQYQNNWSEILAIWHGGIAIHGAIIGGTIAVIVFAKIRRVSVWQLVDLIVPSLALGQAIGRWGNFFNSEAFGSPTNLPWKLYIPPANRPPEYMDSDYFHPTFLYESLWNLLVFSLLLWLFRRSLNKPMQAGTLSLTYMICYSIGRLFIEGLRTDSLMLGNFRVAQLVSLSLIIIGSFGLAWLYAWKKQLPDVAPATQTQNS